MRKLITMLVILIAASFVLVAANAPMDKVFVRAFENDSTITMFDLGDTIIKPLSSAWGNHGTNMENRIGVIGHDGVGDGYTIVVSNISINTPVHAGYFTMQSTSKFGSGFRHIQLGYVEESSNVVHEITPDTTSFAIEGSSSRKSVNLFLWLPDADKEHNLVEANDYNATLSLTVSVFDGHGHSVGEPHTLSIPLLGYYNSERVNSDSVFLNILNYGTVINLRELGNESEIPVGAVEFHSGVVYGTKTPELRYVVGISPSSEGYYVTDDNTFLMKKLYSSSSGFNGVYDKTNSVPLKINLKDTSNSVTSHENTSYVQGGSIVGATSNSSVYTYVAKQSGTPAWTSYNNSRSYGYIYEYSADVTVELDRNNYDPVDLQDSLLGGAYICNIYFYVGTDY